MSDGFTDLLRQQKFVLNSADKDFDPWLDDEETNPSWKIDLGDFWKESKCTCGSATVYGKDTNLHAHYCDKFEGMK